MAGTNVTYTQAAEEQIAAGKSTMRIVETVQFYNAAVGTMSYVLAPEPITAKLETGISVTFQPLNLSVTRPAVNTENVPELTVNMDGVDGDLIDFWNATNESGVKTIIKLRTYNAENLTVPMQRSPLEFTANTIAMKDVQIQIKAAFLDLKNKKFPTEKYTVARFPSLNA